MTPGSGLWWFGLITYLVAAVASLGATAYLLWLRCHDKRDKKRRDEAAKRYREGRDVNEEES